MLGRSRRERISVAVDETHGNADTRNRTDREDIERSTPPGSAEILRWAFDPWVSPMATDIVPLRGTGRMRTN